MIMGIDHGYYAIKTRHFSFPAGVTAYTHEPYTLKNTLQIGGKYYVCGTGRQPILRDKTVNDNYYILTLAAIAMELRCRGLPAESSVTLAAGLPLAGRSAGVAGAVQRRSHEYGGNSRAGFRLDRLSGAGRP